MPPLARTMASRSVFRPCAWMFWITSCMFRSVALELHAACPPKHCLAPAHLPDRPGGSPSYLCIGAGGRQQRAVKVAGHDGQPQCDWSDGSSPLPRLAISPSGEGWVVRGGQRRLVLGAGALAGAGLLLRDAVQLRDGRELTAFLERTKIGGPIVDSAVRTEAGADKGAGASTAWRLDAELIPLDLAVGVPAYSPPEQQLHFEYDHRCLLQGSSSMLSFWVWVPWEAVAAQAFGKAGGNPRSLVHTARATEHDFSVGVFLHPQQPKRFLFAARTLRYDSATGRVGANLKAAFGGEITPGRWQHISIAIVERGNDNDGSAPGPEKRGPQPESEGFGVFDKRVHGDTASEGTPTLPPERTPVVIGFVGGERAAVVGIGTQLRRLSRKDEITVHGLHGLFVGAGQHYTGARVIISGLRLRCGRGGSVDGQKFGTTVGPRNSSLPPPKALADDLAEEARLERAPRVADWMMHLFAAGDEARSAAGGGSGADRTERATALRWVRAGLARAKLMVVGANATDMSMDSSDRESHGIQEMQTAGRAWQWKQAIIAILSGRDPFLSWITAHMATPSQQLSDMWRKAQQVWPWAPAGAAAGQVGPTSSASALGDKAVDTESLSKPQGDGARSGGAAANGNITDVPGTASALGLWLAMGDSAIDLQPAQLSNADYPADNAVQAGEHERSTAQEPSHVPSALDSCVRTFTSKPLGFRFGPVSLKDVIGVSGGDSAQTVNQVTSVKQHLMKGDCPLGVGDLIVAVGDTNATLWTGRQLLLALKNAHLPVILRFADRASFSRIAVGKSDAEQKKNIYAEPDLLPAGWARRYMPQQVDARPSTAANALALAMLGGGRLAAQAADAANEAARPAQLRQHDGRAALALAHLLRQPSQLGFPTSGPVHAGEENYESAWQPGLGVNPAASLAAHFLRGAAGRVFEMWKRKLISGHVEHVWIEDEEAKGAEAFSAQHAGDARHEFNDGRAEAGDAGAAFWLAQQVYFGRGGNARDLNRARELFQRAADAGSPEAALNLGVMRMNAEGGARDPRGAAAMFERAAQLNSTQALTMLGNMAFHGEGGTAKNASRGLELWERAADLGSDAARENVAEIYIQGLGAVKPDGRKAMGHLSRAAAMGSSKALLRLGSAYGTFDSFVDNFHAKWIANITAPLSKLSSAQLADDESAGLKRGVRLVRGPKQLEIVVSFSGGEEVTLILPHRLSSTASLPLLQELAEQGAEVHDALRPALESFMSARTQAGSSWAGMLETYALYERAAVLGVRVALGNAAFLARRLRTFLLLDQTQDAPVRAKILQRRTLRHVAALAAMGHLESITEIGTCHSHTAHAERFGDNPPVCALGLNASSASNAAAVRLLRRAARRGSVVAALTLGWDEYGAHGTANNTKAVLLFEAALVNARRTVDWALARASLGVARAWPEAAITVLGQADARMAGMLACLAVTVLSITVALCAAL